jgi:glycosyltransferase involved in cell wall biosynthesis
MTAVTVDVAGGPIGGAARFRDELYGYVQRTGRRDIAIIGARRRVDPVWLLRREVAKLGGTRRVALNNVGFVSPGGERWTLLGNALHFLTDAEKSLLHPSLQTVARQQAAVVRLAARRSDVLIAPCSAMAERVARTLPGASSRLVVRMHPVSADPVSADPVARVPSEPVILCPVVFSPYKHMVTRLREWVRAVDDHIDPAVRMLVTAREPEVPADLARHPRIELVGQLPYAGLRPLWARSCAAYFPSGLESFGFPLAEARAGGRPVIAQDTAQNREIAGSALCGFALGDPDSLLYATELALTSTVAPDPAPFDPDGYFEWMLGRPA